MTGTRRSNTDRKAGCPYCYRPERFPSPNTHVIKWPPGSGVLDHHGTAHSYACGQCATKIVTFQALAGTPARAYRYRRTGTPRR